MPLLIVFLVAANAFATAAELTLKPGRYEIASTWIVQGQSHPSQPVRRCIATGDLIYPERVFNAAVGQPSIAYRSCTIKNLNYSGGKVAYDQDCARFVTHVEGTYSETGYSVTRTLEPKVKTKAGVGSQIRLEAKRVADCEDAAKKNNP
jgi:hypothetical protein